MNGHTNRLALSGRWGGSRPTSEMPRALALTDDLGITLTGHPEYQSTAMGLAEYDFLFVTRERPHQLDWDPKGPIDSAQWIERLENHFLARGIGDDTVKKYVAAAHLQGEAFDWYVTLRERVHKMTWVGFASTFLTFFDPITTANLPPEIQTRPALLRQEGQPISSYYRQFLWLLATRFPGWSEADRLVQYLLGLDESVRGYVYSQHPRTLLEVNAAATTYRCLYSAGTDNDYPSEEDREDEEEDKDRNRDSEAGGRKTSAADLPDSQPWDVNPAQPLSLQTPINLPPCGRTRGEIISDVEEPNLDWDDGGMQLEAERRKTARRQRRRTGTDGKAIPQQTVPSNRGHSSASDEPPLTTLQRIARKKGRYRWIKSQKKEDPGQSSTAKARGPFEQGKGPRDNRTKSASPSPPQEPNNPSKSPSPTPPEVMNALRAHPKG